MWDDLITPFDILSSFIIRLQTCSELFSFHKIPYFILFFPGKRKRKRKQTLMAGKVQGQSASAETSIPLLTPYTLAKFQLSHRFNLHFLPFSFLFSVSDSCVLLEFGEKMEFEGTCMQFQ